MTSSGRLGIMQKDKGLLRKVTVKNNGQQLRSYTLNYEEGQFGKMLLKSIDQNDSRMVRLLHNPLTITMTSKMGFSLLRQNCGRPNLTTMSHSSAIRFMGVMTILVSLVVELRKAVLQVGEQ